MENKNINTPSFDDSKTNLEKLAKANSINLDKTKKINEKDFSKVLDWLGKQVDKNIQNNEELLDWQFRIAEFCIWLDESDTGEISSILDRAFAV